MYLSRFGRHCRSRCLGHLLPDALDCRRALAMLAEVARWVTLFNRSVGVSYRMSAVGLYHNLRRLMCARRVDVLHLPGLASSVTNFWASLSLNFVELRLYCSCLTASGICQPWKY